MKILKQIFTIFIFLIISIFSYSKPLENSDKLITGKLDNGLEYYIYKNKKPESNATLNLVVKVGSLMEENDEQGIAHFMEHMAFNGTTKFKKNEMIKYLQSIGLKFGGDLNAYTTFDRTVYKLQVPTGKKELEDGIEVLREWASEATILSEEIETEKKVVIEEWRLSQGLTQRLGDVHKKALFSGSKYYNRFPIGLPKVILSADQNLVKGFYNKWYQPKNMAIVAVGDFNPLEVESLIKKYFTYSGANNTPNPKIYDLKKLDNKYITFSDPELRFNSFYITKIVDRNIINSDLALKKEIVDELLFNIINTRLSNITKEKSSPFLQAFIGKYSITKTKDFIDIITIIKNNKLTEGISLINKFLKSTAKNGITQEELILEKDNIFNSLKSIVANKDSIEHNNYAEDLVEYIMYGESFIEPEKELELYGKLLKTISVNDLNKRIKQIYNENSLYFLTTSTEQATINDNKLKDIINDAKTSDISEDFSVTPVTLDPINITHGTITGSEDNNFILSNGIQVYTKPTDFDNDKIIIKLFKKQGSSTDTYEEFINSLVAPQVIELSGPGNLAPKDIETFMKGKNFNLSTYINDYEQGINITSDKENLNNALEYMSYLIYYPKVDSSIFENVIEQLQENIKTRENSPRTVFGDEVRKIYSGNNERRNPLTEKDLDLLSKDNILNEFKSKFGDFSDYKLVIVGSLDGIDIKGMLEKYFASLPSADTNIIPKSLNLNIPQNSISKKIVKGIDKKATTIIIFPYNSQYGYEEKTLYSGFAEILQIALTENVREKIGGVYSIAAYTTLSPENYGEDKLTIYYSCDTNRVEEVKKAVFDTIRQLLYKKIDESIIDSVVKNYAISYSIQTKENSFWTSYLYQKSLINNYKLAKPEEFGELMTENNLWKYNRKAVNLNNFIEVTLIPEKDSL